MGAKFLSVLETPKGATPEPWAEGVRSSCVAWVPGWPLAQLKARAGAWKLAQGAL